MTTPIFAFDNTYVRELPGFYSEWQPEPARAPRLLFFNQSLAETLLANFSSEDEQSLADLFAGNRLPAGAMPIAQAYAGHQFGHFSPQLGDGRALLLGEVIDRQGIRRDITFKGSGRTPFSRGGDGKAAVGPMLREVLMGEGMHALGIPTSRALAVVATGEPVYRDEVLPGAVLTRVATSHIRVGTFEYFAARGEHGKVKQLADYTIARHDSNLLLQYDENDKERYVDFLRSVMKRQAALLAQWMNIGFIHGVMNTDNMALSGESIDFGPCAFMEAYHPATVFSSIDQQGRYAYGNQPGIAQWNLARLAESLLPLLGVQQQAAVERATELLNEFPAMYQLEWLAGVRKKMGLLQRVDEGDNRDMTLADEWLSLLENNKADFTLAWRRLADAAEGQDAALHDLIGDRHALSAWLDKWRARCAEENTVNSNHIDQSHERADFMRRVNPWIIPRNHRVEETLAAASDEGDLQPFQRLLDALQQPYDENPALAYYAEPAPEAVAAAYRTFCGT